MVNAAESRLLLLEFRFEFVGHDDLTDLAEEVEDVLHYHVDEEPEALVDHQKLNG